VADSLNLTFADGSTHRIEVPAGEADATAEAIIKRTGEYATGWISHTDRKRLNLGTIVSIEIRYDSDQPTFEYG
jgi:hypothetical protein